MAAAARTAVNEYGLTNEQETILNDVAVNLPREGGRHVARADIIQYIKTNYPEFARQLNSWPPAQYEGLQYWIYAQIVRREGEKPLFLWHFAGQVGRYSATPWFERVLGLYSIAELVRFHNYMTTEIEVAVHPVLLNYIEERKKRHALEGAGVHVLWKHVDKKIEHWPEDASYQIQQFISGDDRKTIPYYAGPRGQPASTASAPAASGSNVPEIEMQDAPGYDDQEEEKSYLAAARSAAAASASVGAHTPPGSPGYSPVSPNYSPTSPSYDPDYEYDGTGPQAEAYAASSAAAAAAAGPAPPVEFYRDRLLRERYTAGMLDLIEPSPAHRSGHTRQVREWKNEFSAQWSLTRWSSNHRLVQDTREIEHLRTHTDESFVREMFKSFPTSYMKVFRRFLGNTAHAWYRIFLDNGNTDHIIPGHENNIHLGIKVLADMIEKRERTEQTISRRNLHLSGLPRLVAQRAGGTDVADLLQSFHTLDVRPIPITREETLESIDELIQTHESILSSVSAPLQGASASAAAAVAHPAAIDQQVMMRNYLALVNSLKRVAARMDPDQQVADAKRQRK